MGSTLQGVGAAIVAPSSLSLLTASFPQGEGRAKAVALYGATAGIGASLGLVIGGALADWVSWRAGFFLNVPIGAAMIVLAPRYLPETVRCRCHFDLAGALSATLGVGAVVFSIIHSADSSWTSPVTVATLAAGAMALLGLVASERRAAQPIMPLGLFGSRERVGAYLARLLYLGAMIGFFYYTTQYLQAVLGFSAFAAGVAFFPMTVVNFAVALAIPRITARVGQAAPLAAGVALTLARMVWLSGVHTGSSYWEAVALPMLLIGAGQGLAFAPMTSAGIAGVDAADAGAALRCGEHLPPARHDPRSRRADRGIRSRRPQPDLTRRGAHRAREHRSGHRQRAARAVPCGHARARCARRTVRPPRPPRHNRSRCCGRRCPGLASTRRRRSHTMQKLTAPATAKGPAETFTGEVWFDQIYRGKEPSRARVNAVRFTPSARTNWHVHAVGQTMHVTEGIGIVAARNSTVIVMRPGDTVHTPPGEWHWHSAVSGQFHDPPGDLGGHR